MANYEVQKIGSKIKSVLLVGNPNVGKSAIFNQLTGKYVIVSNYPGTSVEVVRGYVKIFQNKFCVIDTPGIYQLLPFSEDERVTRDILLNTEGIVIQVVDSKNLERALVNTFQISDMGKKLVIDLNMDDEARIHRINIDMDKLRSITGLEVVKTDAIQGRGVERLKKVFLSAGGLKISVNYGKEINLALKHIEELLPGELAESRFNAISLLAGDNSIRNRLKGKYENINFEEIDRIIHRTQSSFGEHLRQVITRAQAFKAQDIASRVQVTEETAQVYPLPKLKAREPRSFPSVLVSVIFAILAGVSVRYWNWNFIIIWLLIGSACFWRRDKLVRSFEKATMESRYSWLILVSVLVFTYFAIGELAAGVWVDLLEIHVFKGWLTPLLSNVLRYLTSNNLIMELFFDPTYGLFSVGITYAIAIVFPIVTTFFIIFGIIEDSGYLPRLAMMVNRVLKIIGLNGKAILPLVLGLGCDTMATMTTRILATRKERIIVTLLLALGIPCSAQLGVIMGMAGSISFTMGMIVGMSIILSMVLVGYAASRYIPGEVSDFIQEIPPIRVPSLKNILVKTVARVRWYLKEALPLFILGTFILFLLSKLHLVSGLEQMASPVIVHILGLPPEATKAFLVGFLRRDYAATELFILSKNMVLDTIQVTVGLVSITLFVPCIAHFFIIIKEQGIRYALLISFFVFSYAVICGGILNQVLRIPFIQQLIN